MCVQALSRQILVTWRGLEGKSSRGVHGLPQSLRKFAASPQMPAKLEALTLAVFRVCRLSSLGKQIILFRERLRDGCFFLLIVY